MSFKNFSENRKVYFKNTKAPFKIDEDKRKERVDKQICPIHILVDSDRTRLRLPFSNNEVLRDHFLLLKSGRSNP